MGCEDIYLYMSHKNILTHKFKTELIFNDFVTFEEDKVLLSESTPKEVAILFKLIEPEDVRIVYHMSNPVCECGGKLHKHRIIDWNMDMKYPIYKYQYRCYECDKTIVTPLPGIVDKGCNYTIDIKQEIVNLYDKEHISYANSTDFINEKYNLDMSRQTTFNCNDKESDEYLSKKDEVIEEKLKENDIDNSGYYGHDEAFLRINGEKYSFLAMLDSTNQKIINDQLISEDQYREFLETFITYSLKDLSIYNNSDTPNPPHPLLLPNLKKNTLTGDGLPEYPSIAKKANIDFHPCVFHLVMNQRKLVWKKENRIQRKRQSNKSKILKNKDKIDQYYEKYSGQGKIRKSDKIRRKQKDKTTERIRENKKLNQDNRILKKEFEEFEDLNRRISEIFTQDTIENAKKRFNILNNQIKFLPEEIKPFMRRLEKDLDATLSFIEDKNIPKTNNWLELFFRIVFPKKYRNRFKTVRGVSRFLRSRKHKWYTNVVLKDSIIIERTDIWAKLEQKYITYATTKT